MLNEVKYALWRITEFQISAQFITLKKCGRRNNYSRKFKWSLIMVTA